MQPDLSVSLLTALLLSYISRSSGAVDKTMEEDAVGCGPVKAAYDKVVRAEVFKPDKFMLPRIALSSSFGRSPYRSDGLGIWQTSAANLAEAKKVMKANPKIEKAVRELICIDFGTATQNDMKKPIYSIVCAALIIQGVQGDVPKRFQIAEQKQYWEQASGATVDQFSDSANVLDSESGQDDTDCFICEQGPTDLIFVIDDSGSIGGARGQPGGGTGSEWDMQITYVVDVISKFKHSFDAGTTQGAVVIFGGGTKNYGFEQDGEKLKSYVEGIPHSGETTCTGKGCLAAYDILSKSTRLTDYTVRKIVFILTDGEPSCPDSGLDATAYTEQAKKECNKFKQMKEKPVVYAIGNKQAAKFDVLQALASEPKYARNYVNVADFKSDIIDILFSSCQILVEIPSGSFADMSGSKGGQTLTFDLKGMKEGEWRSFIAPFTKKQGNSAFLIFELKTMTVEVYASFSQPRPSDSAYDAKERCEPGGKKCVVRIDDPTSSLDDMCKASFGSQFYVNVHAVSCVGGVCDEPEIVLEIMPPDYFDIR